ncbi:MAG: hypothetical protein COA49_07965 [Bacteroidetes bacterium]|nr:MAG: hypothetical protein COA49_07965 [Bacteroidota bacterium]
MDLSRFNIIHLLFIAVISSCGNTEGSTRQVLSDEIKAINFEDVRATYGYKCSICHGSEGVSVIRSAPNLVSSQLSIDERVEIISNGKTTMPPQKDVLDESMILGLAMYIDSLAIAAN